MFSAKAFLNEIHGNPSCFRGPNFYRLVKRIFGKQALFLADDTQEVFLDVADGFFRIPNQFLKDFGEVPPENTFTVQINIDLLLAQCGRNFSANTYMNLYELSPIDATKFLIEYYEGLRVDRKQHTTIFLQEFKGEFSREGRMILQTNEQCFVLSFHRPTWEKRFPELSITTVSIYDTRSFDTRLLKFALDFINA